MLIKEKIPYLEFTITSMARLSLNGRKITLIFLISLVFILLSLSNESFSKSTDDSHQISFDKLLKKIQKNDICEIRYNPSKTAAIVNTDCGSAIYINFEKKQTYTVINHWPNIFPFWINNRIAHIEGPCGTGCSQSVIFVAPTTVISCAIHEYRIENLNPNEPPDYNNTPLLIDPKKGIYVCYNEKGKIQTFPLPK